MIGLNQILDENIQKQDTPAEISSNITQSAQPSDPSFHSVGKKTNAIFLTENWTADDPSVLCRYNGHVRPVHPAVCEFHRFSGDPECSIRRCPRVRLGINVNISMQTTEE